MQLRLVVLAALTLGACAPTTSADWDAAVATANRTAVQSQQTFNMSMGMVNQTQVGNLNYQTYQPIQRADGTWIYCIRTSSYTVTCRAS